ncbi:MAG TPA: DNA-formamidopyrimidine glycosylase family protein [Thermoanaerobaculia bacterium]|jgi:endonuclease-8
MPEGDTIHRAARVLHKALAGKQVTRFETVFPQLARIDEDAPLAGRTIERVGAAGKNLLIELSGDLHLHTHMRMNGSWHIYRPGERWRKPRSDMRIVLATEDFVAVAFNVPVAEFHDARSLARQDDLRLIGPDLLGETFDADEAVRRIRARNNEEIADVILNQRVVSGIGNEYKSELLFLRGISPFRKVESVTDEELHELLRVARRVMQMNVNKRNGGRETTGSLDRGQRLYVYARRALPCRKCGTKIEMTKQGRDVRVTFWCPACQLR